MGKFSYILSTLLLSSVIVDAKTFSDDDYLQIISKDLEVKDNIVNANGEVVVYSPDYYITANSLIYDINKTTLELFGNVSIVQSDKEIIHSNHVLLNKKDDTNTFKPLLLLDSKEKLWFNSSSTANANDNYSLEKTTLSSCDCLSPDWSIGFSSGDHNTTKQWINTYNTTLYIKDLPIFYTPYFGFPTGNSRTTGLLNSTIGYSKKEGTIFAQPIFIAPYDNFDFEYIPSIKSKRGKGQELKFRYADSLYSKLEIDGGYFKEEKNYQKEYELANDKHHGWSLKYDRTKLFSSSDTTDGLLIHMQDMNDVDYINTKYDNSSMDYTDKLLESKLTYFYNTNDYFSGADIKYYSDITLENNDEITQSIPLLNFHKYTTNTMLDNLTYSTDLAFSRKIKEIGLGANSLDLSVPLSYSSSILWDYLNITLAEDIYLSNINYTSNNIYKDAQYGRNNHIVSIYTDLLKEYDSTLHTIKLNATYTDPNEFAKSGDIYSVTSSDSNLSEFGLTSFNKNVSVGFNQSFYDKESLSQIVNHKIKQSYIYDSATSNYIKGDLENDITLSFNNGSLSNRLLYNYDINKIVNSTTTFKYNYSDYFFNIYYTYKKDIVTLENQKDINYDLGLDFAKYYRLSYREEYDLSSHLSKKKEYVFNIDKKCWSINFKLIDSLIATNTVGLNEDDVLRQDIFYIEVDLKQLFQVEQKYKFKERIE